MPYNSSAFEKQLAKYKAAQAGKRIADIPPIDQRMQSGIIKPNINSQPLEPKSHGGPVLRADQITDKTHLHPIIRQGKKPLHKRGWFVFLMFSILSTAAIPVFFKDEMGQIMSMAEGVKSSTGVDPFAIKTYTNMIKGQAVGATPPAAMLTPLSPMDPAAAVTDPTDMGQVVQQAQERAQAVTSQGADQSMQFIQSETERLNKMAKELDAQAKASH